MKPVKINIVLFGIGNLGSAIINQIVEIQQSLIDEKGIEIRFPIITNSTLAFFENEYKKNKWDADFTKSSGKYTIQNLIHFVQEEELENLVAIDATASTELISFYPLLVQNGFNILSFNENTRLQNGLLNHKLNSELKKTNQRFLNPKVKSNLSTQILLEQIFKAVNPWILNQRKVS